jgi:SecD/SecF fusion protein
MSSINSVLKALTSLFEDPLTLFVIGMILLVLFFWYFATDLERRKRNVGTILTLGIVALCILGLYPIKEKLRGGIDLVGGSSFMLRVQPKEDEQGQMQAVTPDQVAQAILVVQKRLDDLGTSQPFIARQGEDMIIVQMPGVEPEEAAEVRRILETTAKLELRAVHPESDMPGDDGRALAQRVATGDVIEPGYRAYRYTIKDDDGNERTSDILLSRRVGVGGNHIVRAFPSSERSDAVSVTLNSEGTDRMIALTGPMRKRVDRLAIVLDGVVISAPVVNDTLGSRFEVSGLRDPGEPQNLSRALMNPLENGLIVEDERSVSATLGAAVVKQGIWAGLTGLFITFAFILIYYRVAGIIALVGLSINITILFGIMAMFGFVFTLPGIAGLILTIGIAVDANVLIYERLREEIENGKSIRNAITAAYEKAFSAIFDANITSLITAMILFWLGSSSIKGFAITLTIGLLASMFSSILVTRVLYRWGLDTGVLRRLSFLNLIRSANFNFLGQAKRALVLSSVLVVVSLAAFGVKRENSLGIDFTGGTLIQFQLGETELPIGEINDALSQVDTTREPYAQEESNLATGFLLSVRCDTNDSAEIIAKLRDTFPILGERVGDGYKIQASTEVVSAVIGKEFLIESLIALGIGLLGIMLYVSIRFEFSFAIGALAAIMHDVIISVGLVVLFGRELSMIHVGAILTIAGYSVNDTIVIFDRIRENLLMRGGSVRDIMNEAINATLSRTVITSATTIITVALLSVFGGSTLFDFSVVILIGLIVGTYSSIFVAAPIVLWWSSRKGSDLRRDVIATEIAAEAQQ